MSKENCVLKMRLKVPGKPLLWDIPHYYLCVLDNTTNKICLIFTSNIFKLLSLNFGADDVKRLDPPIENLPFLKKSSYLLLKEKYVLEDVYFPDSAIKSSNAFNEQEFNQIKTACKKSKKFYLHASDIEII